MIDNVQGPLPSGKYSNCPHVESLYDNLSVELGDQLCDVNQDGDVYVDGNYCSIVGFGKVFSGFSKARVSSPSPWADHIQIHSQEQLDGEKSE